MNATDYFLALATDSARWVHVSRDMMTDREFDLWVDRVAISAQNRAIKSAIARRNPKGL